MRKKVALSISCLLLACILLVSLTSCMKIGMKQSGIESRLKDAGATKQYVRTTPMTKDSKGYVFEDLIYSTKKFTRTVDGQETEVVEVLFIIFCGNDATADWAENACKSYVSKYGTDNIYDRSDIFEVSDFPNLNDNFDNPSEMPKLYKWIAYRYDRVVMCGYFELLAIARNY